MDAELKLGILQDVHFAPQAMTEVIRNWRVRCLKEGVLSHVNLLLLATIPFVPRQTPLLSARTQLPLKKYVPVAHRVQSFDVGPVQVRQEGEHGLHAPFSVKLPSGQGTPVTHAVPTRQGGSTVRVGTLVHFVLSFASCVKPDLQVTQSPVPSAH